MTKKEKILKCKFCNFNTTIFKKLRKHFEKSHKQKPKTNIKKLQRQVNEKLQNNKSKAEAYQPIRNLGTFHENVVKKILKQNNAFFEFQPIVFSEELKQHISPDFFISSWKGMKLIKPLYLEIDGNTKDRTSLYQVNRENSLKSKYPVLRIWNSNVNERSIIFLIEKYIVETKMS